MSDQKVYTVIGLMSGTSIDAIDAALIKTDGQDFTQSIASVSIPYDPELRNHIKSCLGRREDIDGRVGLTENKMTEAHAGAVHWLLGKAGLNPDEIDFIGFHGQTIFHDPAQKFTWQIGNGAMLARLTGIDVINDFRSADVAAGGQGAPFLPLYHRALCSKIEGPVMILNLGGVGNITYIDGETIIAFDTGPANALIDDFVKNKTDHDYDENGLLAQNGTINETIIAQYLKDGYFNQKPPKSLDRDRWSIQPVMALSPSDGAATLTRFTVSAVAKAIEFLPATPENCFVTGGGRHNNTMMAWLETALPCPVKPVEDIGWNGDVLEAEGFAYLAARSHQGLPVSIPETTGVPKPLTGGRYHKAA